MREYGRRALRATLGLALFAAGVYLCIQANIGLAPWDCLYVGLAGRLPLSYGVISVCVSAVIVAIDLLLGERIGLGTLIDAVLVGVCVDLYAATGLVPKLHNLWLGLALMLAGIVVMVVGQYVYMSAALCCGPRDTLMVGLGKRMRRVPIGAVNVLLLLAVLAAGALLGGPVGVGTVFSVFGTGIVMQGVYRVIGFEPRDVRHEDLADMARALRGGTKKRSA